MKKFFFLLAISTAALVPASAAVAADLDVPPPPPPTEELRQATYDWTGAYVGAWAGISCMDGSIYDNDAVAPLPTVRNWELDGCGGKGGVMAGYLHQFDSFVLGVEADWGMTGEVGVNDTDGADFAFKMNHLVTGRARAGYAWDDTLFYATGGIAWAQGDLYGIDGYTNPDHIKGSHWGWTVGGGMEHAFTDQFRLRLEYLFTQFKGDNYSEACCDIDVDDFGDHEVKVGLIWAF